MNTSVPSSDYERLVSEVGGLLEQARRTAARSVNSILTATYWEIGRRIVEFEQAGKARAEYGERLLARMADDLTAKHGRGFSARNLRQMRTFYLGWEIWQTPSAKWGGPSKMPDTVGQIGARETPDSVWTIRNQESEDNVCGIRALPDPRFGERIQFSLAALASLQLTKGAP